MARNPVIWLRPDLCPKCNKQSIEIYDYYNKPLGYRNIIDKWYNGESFEVKSKYAIYKMKCRSCGFSYNINWIDNAPLPDFRLNGGLYQQFINSYINEVN